MIHVALKDCFLLVYICIHANPPLTESVVWKMAMEMICMYLYVAMIVIALLIHV